MREPKKHHIIPRFFQANFSLDSGARIFRYDGNDIKCKSAKKNLVENKRYTFEYFGNKDFSTEIYFSGIENSAAPIIKRIILNGHTYKTSAEEIFILKSFLISLIKRSYEYNFRSKNISIEYFLTALDISRKTELDSGVKISESARDALIREGHKASILNALKSEFLNLNSVIGDNNISIRESPSASPFISGSNPYSLSGGRTFNEATKIFLPVSTKHALIFHRNIIHKRRFLTSSEVEHTNKIIAKYSKIYFSESETITKKYIDYYHQANGFKLT